MAKNGQNPKNVKIKIAPYSSPVMFTIISECQKGLKTRERKQNWWGSVNLAKKNTKTQFSRSDPQRNILKFTYSEPARRDDFGKVRHLNGIFFVLGLLQAPCVPSYNR